MLIFFPATLQDWNLIPIKIRAESYLKFNFYLSQGLKAVLLNFSFIFFNFILFIRFWCDSIVEHASRSKQNQTFFKE